MIPQKLQLHNFMSYGQHLPPLDFRGVELACLTGDNGVGKSSLLEAMTWALWGKSRALSDDDLFRHGCRDMWVDFEFKLERSRYRVVRQRSLKKNKGQGSLEFMIGTKSPTGKSTKKRSADDWKSLTGTTKNETQDLINTTLRMNYETFVNSAFLRQGRADEFTIKKSQERKKVLANILNLDYYDRLADQAKANARQATIVAEGLQQQLTHLELEVKDKKALRAEAKNITSQLQVATKIVAKFQKQVTELDRDKENMIKK